MCVGRHLYSSTPLGGRNRKDSEGPDDPAEKATRGTDRQDIPDQTIVSATFPSFFPPFLPFYLEAQSVATLDAEGKGLTSPGSSLPQTTLSRGVEVRDPWASETSAGYSPPPRSPSLYDKGESRSASHAGRGDRPNSRHVGRDEWRRFPVYTRPSAVIAGEGPLS